MLTKALRIVFLPLPRIPIFVGHFVGRDSSFVMHLEPNATNMISIFKSFVMHLEPNATIMITIFKSFSNFNLELLICSLVFEYIVYLLTQARWLHNAL